MSEQAIKEHKQPELVENGQIVSESELLRRAAIGTIKNEHKVNPPLVARLNKKDLFLALGDYIVGAGAEAYVNHLKELATEDPLEFMNRFEKMVQYFKPKQMSASIKSEGVIEINISDAAGALNTTKEIAEENE